MTAAELAEWRRLEAKAKDGYRLAPGEGARLWTLRRMIDLMS